MPIIDNFSFTRRPPLNSLFYFGVIIGWFLVILLISGRISLIFTHIPFEYNEGWNAYLSERAIGLVHAPLYPDPQNSLIFNNYPPLSFYLVGGLGYLMGDMVWAGRILALAAWLGSIALIFRIILQAGGQYWGAHIGALIFALYSSYFFHSYIAMNDPQWMAHFFMLMGLSALIEKQTVLRVATSAIFFIIGGLIKHNLVALPLILTAWLFIRDKKLALLWVSLGLAGILISVTYFDALYQNHFMLTDILHHKRVVTLCRFKKALGRLATFLPLIILAIPFLKNHLHLEKAEEKSLFAYFALLSLFFGVFESFGEGVSYNAFFESLIAFSLIIGLQSSNRQTDWRFLSCLFLIFLPILATAAFYLPRILKYEYCLHQEKQQWDKVISRVKIINKPVICDISEICYWAGKEYALDFFNYAQAVKRGASLEPLNAIFAFSPIILKVTLPAKNSNDLPLWPIILSYPHKTQQISPRVEMVEITGRKK